jgi:hypothetical protein
VRGHRLRTCEFACVLADCRLVSVPSPLRAPCSRPSLLQTSPRRVSSSQGSTAPLLSLPTSLTLLSSRRRKGEALTQCWRLSDMRAPSSMP